MICEQNVNEVVGIQGIALFFHWLHTYCLAESRTN